MKLKDCALSVDQIRASPQFITRAEQHWIDAYNKKLIPERLYTFYCYANYFSLYTAPSFLKDEKNILFRYLGSIVNGIRGCLVDANEYQRSIHTCNQNKYSPIKKLLRIKYDEKASEKITRAFKHFVIELYGSLDLLADVVAIIMPAEIPKLEVGKCYFSDLFAYVEGVQPKPRTMGATSLIDPASHYPLLLHEKLRPLLITTGGGAYWFELLRMYRNKMVHLGTAVLRQICLHNKVDPNERKCEFGAFLPNLWPFMFEEHMSEHSETDGKQPHDMSEFLEENLIHEDIVMFTAGLMEKVFCLHKESFAVLVDAYKAYENKPFHQKAFDELMRNKRQYPFRTFEETSQISTNHAVP